RIVEVGLLSIFAQGKTLDVALRDLNIHGHWVTSFMSSSSFGDAAAALGQTPAAECPARTVHQPDRMIVAGVCPRRGGLTLRQLWGTDPGGGAPRQKRAPTRLNDRGRGLSPKRRADTATALGQ